MGFARSCETWLGAPLCAAEEYDARHAAKFLLCLGWIKAHQESPEPHHRHLATESPGLFHRGSELRFAPTERQEKSRALGRRELKGRARRLERAPPAAAEHLHQPG